MSEFSPDTIQFKANTPQSSLSQELSHWLSKTQHPAWQHWLKTQQQEEALRFFLKDLALPLRLNTLQEQLRTLHTRMADNLLQAGALRQLLYNWQKQTEALSLGNTAAYNKASEERLALKALLAETEWPTSFLRSCYQIETFLAQQAQIHLKGESSLSVQPVLKPPKESIRLKASDSGFRLPSDLQVSVFQRPPSAWLRRATRHLQIAWKDDFSDKRPLRKLLKSLYAALEQEPDYGPALLLLGWVFACMNQKAAAMACLERLRQQKNHSEMIFLIKFLQNRPLL